jgi:hypothetical protein
MQATEMRTKLEEKIKALEKEKSLLLEEVKQLKELVELSEKAKGLESEVDKLKGEVKTLKDRIPREFLEELGESAYSGAREEEEDDELEDECSSCQEEELV